LSKWCGAGGWRLGTFTFPSSLRWLLDAVAVVASETFTSTSAPIQHAAVRAYEGGVEIELYLHNSRRILQAIASTMTQRLRGMGLTVIEPEGGFYIFPSFDAHREKLLARGITTSTALCEKLLDETGIAALPGSEFGRPNNELTARMAFVDFDGSRALVSAEAIPLEEPLPNDFLGIHCGKVLTALDRLEAWLNR